MRAAWGVQSDVSPAVQSGGGAAAPARGPESRPEFADVGRLAKGLMQRTVTAARAEERSIGRLLADHLGGQAAELPVARGAWAAYDRVNAQTGLEAWLAALAARITSSGSPSSGTTISGWPTSCMAARDSAPASAASQLRRWPRGRAG